MCFTFKKKWIKKPVNCFLHDGASAGIYTVSADLYCNKTLPNAMEQTLDIYPEELVVSETSESRNVVPYLDLLTDISNSDLVCSNLTKGRVVAKILATR